MTTDDTRFSIASVWSLLYYELKHTQWTDDDVNDAVYRKNHSARPAAVTLKYIYDLAGDWSTAAQLNESPLAVLKAAHTWQDSAFLTPGQVKEMAQNFSVYYTDFETPMNDFLERFCGPIDWSWLNDHGRQAVKQSVCPPSEIWVNDPRLSGVWVFNRPGTPIDEMLKRTRLVDNPPPAPVERVPE